MIIYKPYVDANSYTVWYGGKSTQLHYVEVKDGNAYDMDVRTVGSVEGIGMSEMHHLLASYYHDCQDMKCESRMEMAS